MRVVAPIDAMLFAEAEPDRQFDDKTGFTQIKRQTAGNKGEKIGNQWRCSLGKGWRP